MFYSFEGIYEYGLFLENKMMFSWRLRPLIVVSRQAEIFDSTSGLKVFYFRNPFGKRGKKTSFLMLVIWFSPLSTMFQGFGFTAWKSLLSVFFCVCVFVCFFSVSFYSLENFCTYEMKQTFVELNDAKKFMEYKAQYGVKIKKMRNLKLTVEKTI